MPSSCTCLYDIPGKIQENQPFIGLKVSKATIKEKMFIWSNSEYRTHSQIELTCEGRKRPVFHSLVHSFCPFCGKAYPELDKPKEVTNA